MARHSKTPLPVHTEKAGMADTTTAVKPGHALTWHIRKPAQGPRSLAIKNHFVAMVGEYVGTTLFLLLAFGGTNVANIPNTSVTGDTTTGEAGSTAAAVNTSSLLYIALCFGFSLAVNAWIFFRVSGGLFNPAVSLGMLLVGAITPLRAALLTFSQILGGITGAAIIDAITPGTLNIRTQLSPGTSIVRGLFIEMFMTALLMLTILLLAAEKHKATFLAPIGIGLALFIAELMSVYYTGGSLNPARSFGPCVVLKSFNHYHWIYWVGPILGAMLAAGFYKFIKYLEFETVLGPEDGESVPKRPAPPSRLPTLPIDMNSTAGGAPGMGSTAPAGTMYEANPVESSESSGPTMAVQGAGLGDLLTQGDSAAVFDLNQNTDHYYNERFNRIEALLGELLANKGADLAHQNSDPRSSMATLTDGDHSAGGHHKIKSGSGFERSGDLERGVAEEPISNGPAYGMRDAHNGETTVAGHPTVGSPLGQPINNRY